MSKIKSRKLLRLIRKTLYYLIPPAILVYIFMKIDINSFFTSLKNIDLKYFLLGLAFIP